MSLSHIFSHGVFLNRPVFTVLILQIIKVLLGDPKDPTAIKFQPTPSLVLDVLVHYTIALGRKISPLLDRHPHQQ